MSDTAHDSDNYCYRHPDRQSYILCQRCGRTVCPECSTQAAVGVHCPECVKEARQSAPKRRPRLLSAFRPSSQRPVVTYSLIGINLVVFVLQLVTGGAVTNALVYPPVYTGIEPWRMITSMFLHSESSFFHILFNMYSLFIFGPTLESLVGRVRFLALYLLAGFGGSVGVLLLGDPATSVLGASGAIFGLFGAYFLIARRLGGNTTQLLVVIVLNLALGFIVSGVAWQAHVGGLAVGLAVAFVYLQTRRPEQRVWQIVLVAGIAVALVVTTVLTYQLKIVPFILSVYGG